MWSILLAESVINNSSLHNYSTRGGNSFYVESVRIFMSQKCTFYKRIRVYNKLSQKIQNLSNIRIFKNKVRKYQREKNS